MAILAEEGFSVTQATISRDLNAIGATKQPTRDGPARYTINDGHDPSVEEESLGKAINEFALTITPSGSLVVLRTPPGAAHVVAAAIDGSSVDGILGTVAGDDTLLVVADGSSGGYRVATELERIGSSV